MLLAVVTAACPGSAHRDGKSADFQEAMLAETRSFGVPNHMSLTEVEGHSGTFFLLRPGGEGSSR